LKGVIQLGKVACFVGPHPDDVEIGAGGTIAKLSKLGWACHVVIVTTHTTNGAIRAREAISAAGILGVREQNVHALNFPDGGLAQISFDTLKSALFEKIQKEIRADLVFGPSHNDRNEDHRVVCPALQDACRTIGTIEYYVPHHIAGDDLSTTLAIDIEDYVGEKLNALRQHRTELERGSLSESRFLHILSLGKIGTRHFEKFHLKPPVGYNSEIFHRLTGALNDDLFGHFWFSALKLQLAESVQALNFIAPVRSDGGPTLEPQGRILLQQKLRNFFPAMKLETCSHSHAADVEHVSTMAKESHCIFSGGPLVNPWVHRFIHCHPSLVLRRSQYLRNAHLAAIAPPGDDAKQRYADLKDVENSGALVVMWGWGRRSHALPTTIYAAGARKVGTAAALSLLTYPPAWLVKDLRAALNCQAVGIQWNFWLGERGTNTEGEIIKRAKNLLRPL
jgi:LmbE family N-acetylglucosaminyl deacetylase